MRSGRDIGVRRTATPRAVRAGRIRSGGVRRYAHPLPPRTPTPSARSRAACRRSTTAAGSIRPQQSHRAPWAARPGAAPTSPRVLPDRDSARPLIGPALPEQRGVAVRRTTPPLPGLTAPPDRHAPHRQQHRRRRQSPRPAPHHHLTGRTPHQKT